MSYDFESSESDYLSVAAAPATDAPCSIAVWIKCESFTDARIVSITQSGSSSTIANNIELGIDASGNVVSRLENITTSLV